MGKRGRQGRSSVGGQQALNCPVVLCFYDGLQGPCWAKGVAAHALGIADGLGCGTAACSAQEEHLRVAGTRYSCVCMRICLCYLFLEYIVYGNMTKCVHACCAGEALMQRGGWQFSAFEVYQAACFRIDSAFLNV